MKVIVSKPLSDNAIKNIVSYLFELVEKYNLYDELEKASK